MPETGPLSSGQIASIVKEAEQLVGQREYEKSYTLAASLIPEVVPDRYPVIEEMYRTKMRIYDLLQRLPGFGFVSPEMEDALSVSAHIFREKGGVFTPEEKVVAHLLYYNAMPGGKLGEEENEWRATVAAEELLGKGGTSSQVQAIAHTLLCCRSPSTDVARQHLESFLLLPKEVRGEFLTTLACTQADTGIDQGNLRFTDQALKETEEPLYRARLYLTKMWQLMRMFMQCGDEDSIRKWEEAYDDDFDECFAQIQTVELAVGARLRAHFAMAYYLARHKEVRGALSFVRVGGRIAKAMGLEGVEEEVQRAEENIKQLAGTAFAMDNDGDDASEEWRTDEQDQEEDEEGGEDEA